MIVRRYVLAWLGMLGLAIANGVLRQMTFGKFLSELRAHQLSTLLGAVLIGAFMWVVLRRWPPSSHREALAIGLLWMALTIAFECFMGLVLLQRSLAQVLADYNVCAGRVWVFFLLWLAVAPWLFVRFHAVTEP